MSLAVLVIPSVSCFGAPDFRCRADADCTWGERQGVCEPTDYCSYPDGECPSGRRYSDQAGSLAERCVDEPPGVETDPGTSAPPIGSESSDTAGSSSEGTPDATTSAPQPACGNGEQEGDERCDDGNAIDGDGCNVDCVPSGVPRWDPPERIVSGAEGADAFLAAVDVRPDDTIIAVGREDVIDVDALLVLLDGDGEVVWVRQHDGGTGDDLAGSVSAAVGSEIYVAGGSIGPPAAAWVAVVEPANGEIERMEPTGRPIAAGLAYQHPTRLVVGGYGDGTFGARVFTEMLVQVGVAESATPAVSVADAAADGVDDVAWIAASSGESARVLRLQPDDAEPLVSLFEGEPGTGAQGLAYGDGMLVLVGYAGMGMRDGWMQTVAVGGAPGWSWTTGDPSEDEIEDVAIAPSGHVVAAGFSTAFAQDARVWKLGPDGELAWTWAPDEPWPNDDVARGVAVRADGDVVVVGERTGEDGSSDGWVVRLTP